MKQNKFYGGKRIPLGKGSKKKKNLWKIPYRVLTPPWLWKNFFIFFLKLDHFLRTFCKKCIFTIENPKKFLPPQMPDCFAAQNFVHNTRNFSLDMILSP